MPKFYPPFSLEEPLYDQSTMIGRAKQFYTITDPRSLFITKKQVEESKALISAYENSNLPTGISDEKLWNARRIVESVIHPSTGKPINPLLRFACYAPMNIFIVSAMVLPSTITSIPRTIFVHWYNQSYNAAVNYANGSSATPVPPKRLIEGYIGAVGSSLAIALGATYITQKTAHLGSGMTTLIRATLPFSAVVGAGCVNLCLIRRNEITEGVEVFDKDDKPHGFSKTAGKLGILKCCAARFVWNVPAMIAPPAIVGLLATKPWWKSLSPRFKTATEICLITFFLMAGVPPALGLFPQKESIDVSKLEEQFHNLKDKNGYPIKKLYYNKGL